MQSCVAHPGQNEVSRSTVFGGQENARKVLRGLGDLAQPVDPPDDLIAEG
jgi:hypothetical protein